MDLIYFGMYVMTLCISLSAYGVITTLMEIRDKLKRLRYKK